MTETLNYLLSPLHAFLADPAVEEVCVNKPNEAWIWAKGKFTRHQISLSALDAENIAIVAAAQRRQNVGYNQPLLATDLSGSGRLQVVLEPCVARGSPSLTIRRGSSFSPSLEQLSSAGLFQKTTGRRRNLSAADGRLIQLYREENWQQFFAEAVAAKKTIISCGETASGKTTFSKALINAIPLHERLLTIEDTPEWIDLPHQNWVAMYYDNTPGAPITASHLVSAALRMRIGRLLLQEIRDGAAAMAFLTALQTGHPGGITTVHARDASQAFDRFCDMIKRSEGGGGLTNSDILPQLFDLIDIVVHCHRDLSTDVFSLSEVWFAPVALQDKANALNASKPVSLSPEQVAPLLPAPGPDTPSPAPRPKRRRTKVSVS